MTLCFKFLLEWLQCRRGPHGITPLASPPGWEMLIYIFPKGDGIEKKRKKKKKRQDYRSYVGWGHINSITVTPNLMVHLPKLSID